MDRAIYDRMAEMDGEHWWFVARRRIIARLIEAQTRLKSDARILEVGCGPGSNIPLLQRYGRVDALEPDAPARAIASQRTGVAVKGGLLPDGVDLKDGAYDLIAMFDVLEHIPDDYASLKALRSKLAPGGRLILTVPAMPWLWSAHDLAHHHHRRYTAHSLKAVFERAGYRVRHQTHFNTLLFPLVVAARAAGKIVKRKGGDDALPSPRVNRLLTALFASEAGWVAKRSLPFGVSLALVAEPAPAATM